MADKSDRRGRTSERAGKGGERLAFSSPRLFVDNLERHGARQRVVDPVDAYGLVSSAGSHDLSPADMEMASLGMCAKAASLLLRYCADGRVDEVADILWEACSLRPARWLWQLAFEMGIVEVDVAGLSRLARSTERAGSDATGSAGAATAQVRDLALGIVRSIARLDGTSTEVGEHNAALICEAWSQSYAATRSLSHGLHAKLETASVEVLGRPTLSTLAMCNDLLTRPQRTMIRTGIGVEVVCRNRSGNQTTLRIDPGAYVDVTHLDAEQLQIVLSRERKRYRTVRTIERPTRSRENLTYLSHIWHGRVYENREDPHMADILLDLEDKSGKKRRRYVTLPQADVRPDKHNPDVRYAVVRTRELMLYWFEGAERKMRYERIATDVLVEQMRRSYETYRASRQ